MRQCALMHAKSRRTRIDTKATRVAALRCNSAQRRPLYCLMEIMLEIMRSTVKALTLPLMHFDKFACTMMARRETAHRKCIQLRTGPDRSFFGTGPKGGTRSNIANISVTPIIYRRRERRRIDLAHKRRVVAADSASLSTPAARNGRS